MTEQHTPGPWEVDGLLVSVETPRLEGYTAMVVADCGFEADSRGGHPHYSVAAATANARLIAAAPGMLAALKLALFGVTRDYEVNGAIDRHAITGVLRDAIATEEAS
jgi:hypothetical protein